MGDGSFDTVLTYRNHEDPRLLPVTLYKEPVMVMDTCNLSTEEVETGRSLGLTWPANLSLLLGLRL